MSVKPVTSKTTTLRRAVASARVRTSREAIERLRSNDLPKKDVIPLARAAGTMAAKRTWELIPYCHPLPVDAVTIEFEVGGEHIDITALVEAIWKTGVEMEALTAASVAALTVYDMLKAVDTDIVIEAIALEEKRGGKRDFRQQVRKGFTAAVVVTSDATSAGEREDRSGRIIESRLEKMGIASRYQVLPDDVDKIVATLRDLVADGVDLILTTGGTGLGPRDVTVEATRQVIEREIPGVAEAARSHGQSRTPYAMLSRGLAGVCGKSIIVNLPGSSRGAAETMDAIFPALLHAFPMLGGMGH